MKKPKESNTNVNQPYYYSLYRFKRKEKRTEFSITAPAQTQFPHPVFTSPLYLAGKKFLRLPARRRRFRALSFSLLAADITSHKLSPIVVNLLQKVFLLLKQYCNTLCRLKSVFKVLKGRIIIGILLCPWSVGEKKDKFSTCAKKSYCLKTKQKPYAMADVEVET